MYTLLENTPDINTSFEMLNTGQLYNLNIVQRNQFLVRTRDRKRDNVVLALNVVITHTHSSTPGRRPVIPTRKLGAIQMPTPTRDPKVLLAALKAFRKHHGKETKGKTLEIFKTKLADPWFRNALLKNPDFTNFLAGRNRA